MSIVIRLVKNFVSPKSLNRDKARKEFILNILLLGSLIITFFGFIVNIINRYYDTTIQGALAPQLIILLFIFLFVLLFLSKKEKEQIAAILLILFFYFSATYTIYIWGAQIPIAWLIYGLIIVMSGVLIGTSFAFFTTLTIFATSSFLAYNQAIHAYRPDLSWLNVPYSFGDAVLLNITLTIIAVITWLYTKEIEKSLIRARTSEAELKKERDMLEVKVEERTKDLKRAQLEKMTQIYRFAEIGRLSSGLFHDLATPLSLVSLHLDRMKYKQEQGSIDNVQAQLKKAIHATNYLESFVKAVRKQLQSQGSEKMFSINKEIKMVIQMLNHKAKTQNVKIILHATKEIKIYGDQVKFSQLMINLILNAIDAYETKIVDGKDRSINIHLSKNDHEVRLLVQDYGVGILNENIKKVFQPFFTTKSAGKGTGIGLSISQEIVEKNFGGKIYVQSTKKTGTIFTTVFPFIKEEKINYLNENQNFLANN